MKKVMLIQPWKYHDEGIPYHDLSQEWRNGPYSLLLLSTLLKEKSIPVYLVDLHPVLIHNAGKITSCLKYLKEAIIDFQPDIIGVSFFSYQYIEVEKIVKYAKKVCKDINLNPLFIAGGIHASVEPKQTIEQLGFDYAFVGEGELGLLDLSQGETPEQVPGIVSLKSESFQPAKLIDDLNSLPFPDWQLCDYKFYSIPSCGKISLRLSRTLDIMMGRGCIYRCSFCAYPTLSKVRFYSAEYLIEQIKKMKQSYRIDSVYFIDSSIGNNREVLKQFCELAIKVGLAKEIEWYANMRANQVNESLLRLMWEAGCRSLFYGFESGSQKVLDAMNKRCKVEDNVRVADLHNRLRFPYHASMILGFPGETEEDIKLTLEFLQQVRPPRVGINWYVPLPGSPDYNKLKQDGLIKVEDPHEWRRIGEVLTTGKVYAAVEEKRFRRLFSEACELASQLNVKHISDWAGQRETPHTSFINTDKIDYSSFISSLREKWREIPATRKERIFSKEMINWPDDKLLAFWEECKQQTTTLEVRGWYQDYYKDIFKGCELADIGPGIGIDGIFFAQNGASVTFVDIVKDNLKLIERICILKRIKANFYYIDDFFNYHFKNKFDVFMFIGSMHNAPFYFSQKQVRATIPFLRTGGKVVMLAYPKERYESLGAQDFTEFGRMTDGERTPWAEWYDNEKIKALFGPNFQLNWSRNFGKDGIEFNWFDLTKIRDEMLIPSGTPEDLDYITVELLPERKINIPVVSVLDLHKKLKFDNPIDYPKASLVKPLSEWKMEVDDSPIFRYIYRNFQPRRHLEFGTWQGTGTVYCLEESNAIVWTINPPFGENKPDGSPTYGHNQSDLTAIHAWARKIGFPEKDSYRTDSLGFIGRFYLEKELGHRVCQIYCDSRRWDITNYPSEFFDTVLIDGGHMKDIVINDTRKALRLLKQGGIIMWHDFCPPIFEQFEVTRGVMEAISQEWEWIISQMNHIFWIYPSWILLGIKGVDITTHEPREYAVTVERDNLYSTSMERSQNGTQACLTNIGACGQSENGGPPFKESDTAQLEMITHISLSHKIKESVRKFPVLGFLIWWVYMILKTPKKISELFGRLETLEEKIRSLYTKDK
ncbi:MAG: radical SAM protein [Thermodesulfovibrionales bacterium]